MIDEPPRARIWDEPDGRHIDVRGLSAPQPLVETLKLIAGMPDDGVVVMHHDRDPVMLYAELAQIGWWAYRIDSDAGEVRLRIARPT